MALLSGGIWIALLGAASRKELLDSVVEAALPSNAQNLPVSRPRSTRSFPRWKRFESVACVRTHQRHFLKLRAVNCFGDDWR
jgi:hypothetical protein